MPQKANNYSLKTSEHQALFIFKSIIGVTCKILNAFLEIISPYLEILLKKQTCLVLVYKMQAYSVLT